MRGAIVSIFVILTLNISGCGDKAINQPVSGVGFPNGIGSVWVYAVHDSLGEKSYDLTVSIVDSTSIMGKSVTVWTYESNNVVDTQYVYISGDTVMVYSDGGADLKKMYVFPLFKGKSWNHHSSSAWDYFIDRRAPVDVPAGRFANAYHINGAVFMPNLYSYSTEWYVPGIGAVMYYRLSICTVCYPVVDVREVWQLKSCRLTE